jgi:hypothetical protein
MAYNLIFCKIVHQCSINNIEYAVLLMRMCVDNIIKSISNTIVMFVVTAKVSIIVIISAVQ